MISIFYLKTEKQKSSLFVFLIFTFFITLKTLSLKKLLLYQSTCQINLTLFFPMFPFDQKNLCSSDVFREIKGNTRNTGKYRPEKTPYLDTFHAVHELILYWNKSNKSVTT